MVTLGIADDEPDILKLFGMVLDKREYPIAYMARNGVEAVEMQRTTPADVVFLDYGMPLKDGLQATREILGEFPDTKVYLMTCGEDLPEPLHGLGDVTILKKPFPLKSVLEMLDCASAR